jgi:hypothetical protein
MTSPCVDSAYGTPDGGWADMLHAGGRPSDRTAVLPQLVCCVVFGWLDATSGKGSPRMQPRTPMTTTVQTRRTVRRPRLIPKILSPTAFRYAYGSCGRYAPLCKEGPVRAHLRHVSRLESPHRDANARSISNRARTSDGLGGEPSPPRVRHIPGECCLCWWALRGSNPRPPPCKGGALPAELNARRRGIRG